MTYPNIPLYDLYYDITVSGDINFNVTSENRKNPLRVAFDIVRKTSISVNQSTVSIYNLTIEDMKKIQKLSNLNVKIKAGFKNQDGFISGLILDAPIQYSRMIPENTDYILTMVVVEGFQVSNDVVIQKYSKNQLISNVLDSLGERINGRVYIAPDVQGVLPNDYYIADTAERAITKIARAFGLKKVWYHNTLHIYAKTIPIRDELVEINYKSGLIKYPTLVDASTVKVQTLLNPAIPFLGSVRIDSTEPLFIDVKDYNQSYAWLKNISNLGIMQVVSQRHQGDTRETGVGSWMTEIEAVGSL